MTVRFSFLDDNFTDYVPGKLDKSIQRRFEQSFDIAMGAILRSILFRHRWTEAIGLDSFRAKLCHIRSTGRHRGKHDGTRILRLLTCSIARYISVSRRDAGASGRVEGIGTIFIAGSPMTRFTNL